MTVDVDRWYDAEILERYCRSCGARPGDLCRSRGGNLVGPHQGRQEATQTARRQSGRPKGIPKPTRLALLRRSGGWCEACPLIDPTAPKHPGEDPHHKRMRSQGGTDDLDNLIWVCRRAHRLIHDQLGRQAYDLGLLVRATAEDT